MEIRRNIDLEESILASLSSGMMASGASRPKGPHVSEIVNDIAISLDMMRIPNSTTIDTEVHKRFAMGFAWEDVIGKALAEQMGAKSIGQFSVEKDGIWGTPDRYTPGTGQLDEFKATWISAREDKNPITGERFWRWWAQVKAYCAMIGTYWANIYVFHVNGEYSPPAPQIKVWSAQFTDADLTAAWRQMTNRRDKMVRDRGEWWNNTSQF